MSSALIEVRVPPASNCDYFSKIFQATQVSKLPLRGYPGSFLSPRMGASARSQGRQPLENGPPSPAGFPPSAAPTPGDARGWGGGRGNGCGGDPVPGADAPGYVLTPLRGFPDSLLQQSHETRSPRWPSETSSVVCCSSPFSPHQGQAAGRVRRRATRQPPRRFHGPRGWALREVESSGLPGLCRRNRAPRSGHL